MVNVFISHSKEDKELVGIIDQNFRSVGVTPLFMEFTPESEPPPYKKIEGNIDISSAVFLFLTQNVKFSDYTQNWILFEVGLAKKSNKPLFIMEDVNNKVHFPVPYLTDYVLYEPTKIQDWQEIQKILRKLKLDTENKELLRNLAIGGAIIGGITDEKDRIRGVLVGGFAGSVLGGIICALKEPIQLNPIRVRCFKCKIEFNLYSRFREFPCPSCRTDLRFGV